MIWVLLALGVVLTGAVTYVVGALAFESKAVLALLGTGSVVLVAFVTTAVLTSAGAPSAMNDFSHAQLEADRLMTQEMATVVGPGMDIQMTTNGMLTRSSNDAYLRALEEHVYQVDRMLGRVPGTHTLPHEQRFA